MQDSIDKIRNSHFMDERTMFQFSIEWEAIRKGVKYAMELDSLTAEFFVNSCIRIHTGKGNVNY